VTERTGDLHEVRILELPLAVQARAQEQHAELMREFALLAIDGPVARAGHDVPQRLIQLIDDLSTRFGGIGTAADSELAAAADRGADSVDLVYHVPTSVADACELFSGRLDEADDFCRAGERLLTLAAAADLVAFRHWYLGEFTRQVRGAAPMSWPQYVREYGVVIATSNLGVG
jgi:hypothetical protein